MKRRAFPFLVALVAAILLLISWSFSGLEVRSVFSSKSLHSSNSAQSSLGSTANRDTVRRSSGTSASPDMSSLQAKERMLRELAVKSNKPIHFYGVVLDQDDLPIEGVRVTLAIRTARESFGGLMADEFEYPVQVTNAQGRFEILDAKGALLSVKSLERDGYEESERKINQAYWYWNDPRAVFHPDSERPEIFRMWKLVGAEPLVHKRVTHPIKYDGTPTYFDLVSGTAAAMGGDLRVTLTRSPEEIQWGQTHYEWTLIVEVIEGGIIVSADEQMYRAPAEGYKPMAVFHMDANDPNWTPLGDEAAYVKLRGGKYYGRIMLQFMVGGVRGVASFRMETFVNPKGSKNLEYDPLRPASGEGGE